MCAGTEVYSCKFCKKSFKRESTLSSHKCALKSRALDQDTRLGRMALEIWVQFRNYNMIKMKKTQTRWQSFSESKEYKSFMDFAEYLIKVRIIKQDEFIEYLISSSIPIRAWKTDETRRKWIQTVTRREHPDTAIERSLLTIQDWAEENNTEWFQFFNSVSVGRAILWIETGKISPWLLHTSSTFKNLINRMDDQNIASIYEFLDPHVWNVKLLNFKNDVTRIKNVFKEYNF